MLVKDLNGEYVEINRKDFLTDSEYYTKMVMLKYGSKVVHHLHNKKEGIINKMNFISLIKKTECM